MPTKTKTKTKAQTETQVTDVLLAWCIDKSGSMDRLQRDTIDGFNAFLEEQQGIKDGRAYLSMLQFDTDFKVPYAAQDILEVEPLTTRTYQPRGGTALYDAVGITIDGVEAWLKNNDHFDGKVLITVWTDGEENSSKTYGRYGGGLKALMDRVQEKQDEGWIFSFLGAGGAAWTEGAAFAGTLGVHNTTQVSPTSSGVRASYAASSTGAKSLRSTGQYAGTSDYLLAATADSATMNAFGVTDATEALAGTSNKTSTQVEDDEDE